MRIECPECRFTQEIREDKIPDKAVNATCPQCGSRFKFRTLEELRAEAEIPTVSRGGQGERDESESAEEYAARRKAAADAYTQAAHSGMSPIVWEAYYRARPLHAFVRTLIQIITQPARFFSLVPYSGKLALPIAFALALCVLRTTLIIFTLRHQLGAYILQNPAEAESLQQLLDIPTWTYILVSVPTFFLENGLIALVCHASLRILQPATANLRTTVRVVAYANAAWIFALIPQFGFNIAFVVLLVLLYSGMKAAHRVSLTTAISATLGSLFMLILAVLLLASFSRSLLTGIL